MPCPAFVLSLAAPLAWASPQGPVELAAQFSRMVREPTLFGTTVDGAGDLDLDGYGDVILGAHWHEPGGRRFGTAVVVSGQKGAELFRVHGEEGALFGLAVAGAGDTDADGAADFLVGAPRATVQRHAAGKVFVHSGRDGSVLLELEGRQEDAFFGWSARSAGDVNQDGFADLVVGAPGDGLKRDERTGVVRVYSGKNGKLLHEFAGAEAGDLFGVSVDGAGDQDGDGSSDVVAGAGAGGYVWVLSGRTGERLHEYREELAGTGFGWNVRRAGDTDADGFAEVIVGTASAEGVGAKVYSGKKGELILRCERPNEADEPGYGFGQAIDGAGDVNADGFDDLVVGDPGFPARLYLADGEEWGPMLAGLRASAARPGRVSVLSGKDSELLHALEGEAPDDWFGVSVAGAGDVNSDGTSDVIVGAGRHAKVHARIISGLDGNVLHTLRVEE